MLGGYPRLSTVSLMTSKMRRCRSVNPSASVGPSGNGVKDALSPSWAATSLSRGRPRRLLGCGYLGSLCAIRLTIENSADRFKHLFERVEDLSWPSFL